MRAEKKENIYKAALGMIKKTGVHGLAMGQLSKESGIAAGTFYHYFASKEAMLQETFLYCHKRAVNLGLASLKIEGSFEKKFTNLILSWYTHFGNNPVELYFVVESEAGNSVSKNTILDSREYYKEIYDFIQFGINQSFLGEMDPNFLVQCMLSQVFNVIKYSDLMETKITEIALLPMLNVIWAGFKTKV